MFRHVIGAIIREKVCEKSYKLAQALQTHFKYEKIRNRNIKTLEEKFL